MVDEESKVYELEERIEKSTLHGEIDRWGKGGGASPARFLAYETKESCRRRVSAEERKCGPCGAQVLEAAEGVTRPEKRSPEVRTVFEVEQSRR